MCIRDRRRSEDCADLSMLLLIEFAASNGLPVTLRDNDGNAYSSKGEVTYHQRRIWGLPTGYLGANTWGNKDEFYQVVRDRIGAEALFKENTASDNNFVPAMGDLLLNSSHCAIVFRVYPPGAPHQLWNNSTVPDLSLIHI